MNAMGKNVMNGARGPRTGSSTRRKPQAAKTPKTAASDAFAIEICSLIEQFDPKPRN
jgi:hypothetical protein